MVFSVDSSGDGLVDHAVTVVGYRETNGYPEYAAWDTWNDGLIRWERFRPSSDSYPWGVVYGTTFSMEGGVATPKITSFTANPTTINTGQSSTLSWATVNTTGYVIIKEIRASSLTVVNTFDSLPLTGSFAVNPTESAYYNITAFNSFSGKSVSSGLSSVITVNPIAPPPPPTDTTMPAVSITGITGGATYSSGRYTIVGNATDASGIAKIEIIVSGKVMATCSNVTTCSYVLNIKKLAVGTHTITVKAYDKAPTSNVGTNQIMIARVK